MRSSASAARPTSRASGARNASRLSPSPTVVGASQLQRMRVYFCRPLDAPPPRGRRCVIELYVFFEMTAAATRIEMIDFGGMPPYASEGQTAQHSELVHVTPSRSSRLFDRGTRRRMPSTTAAADSDGGAAPTARLSRFDVREARCAVHADEDALRSAIESCGAGVDAFNAWMHDMLVACVSPSKRTSLGRSQRGSKVTPMLPYSTPELHQLRDSRPIRD